jgi:hypothetical protein
MAQRTKRDVQVQSVDRRFSVLSTGDEIVEIVGLRAEIKLWCDRPFNEFGSEFLRAYDALVAPIKQHLAWYQNYTMNRFAPVSAKTFSAPQTWLRSGRPDQARMLHLKGPDAMKAAGQYVVHFKYHPDEALYADTNTPFVRQATPHELLDQNPEQYVERTQQLADLLPYLCGHAGYSLETSPYYEMQAHQEAYALAMRHPGTTIATHHATWPLRDEKGVEAVNWLTLVGEAPLKKLGGAAKLRQAFREWPAIRVLPTKHGVIIQAGERPSLGDVNRGDRVPQYAVVYKALKPVIEPVAKRFRPLPLGLELDENAERTARWLARFDA